MVGKRKIERGPKLHGNEESSLHTSTKGVWGVWDVADWGEEYGYSQKRMKRPVWEN